MSPTPSGKRIVFTGGSGKAGRHVIPYLLAQGHQVLNLDLVPLDNPNVLTLKTDLTSSGQVFNALTTHFSYDNYKDAHPPQPPDAIIHFGAYARNMLVPDNECFRGNVLSTYNVIEAACKLGVKKIIIASSETVYGVCFGQGDLQYDSFPLEEDSDVNPMDTYALSKICGEKTARAFATRYGVDIYALRIGNVIEPHEYTQKFPTFLEDPMSRKRNAWSYIDARDLGQICHLCVEKDGLGFEVFNATNDGITTKVHTKQFLESNCPETRLTREMAEWEAPLSNRKIRGVLGFNEEHDWRRYVNIVEDEREDVEFKGELSGNHIS